MKSKEVLEVKVTNSIVKSAIIVSALALFSKLFGFARDAVIASKYGANTITDAFFLSQNLPGLIFPAVCNGFSSAFFTIFVTKCNEKGNNEVRYSTNMILYSGLVAIVLSLIAIFMIPFLIPFFAPGFDHEQMQLSILLSRITMSAFVITMIQYMLSAILNVKKMFYVPHISGIIYNITVVVLTLILSNDNIIKLTVSIIIGHFIQIIVLLIYTRKFFNVKAISNKMLGEYSTLVKLTFPILLGNSLVQINNIIDKILASYLEEGATSALSYSNSLNRLIIGIFITSISTVLYQALSTYADQNKIEEFQKSIISSINTLLLIITPISILIFVKSVEIVRIVYGRGAFDSNAISLTATALKYYSIMFIFVFIQELITRAFYSLKDTKTPMIYGAIGVIFNSIFSIILVRFMGIGGIALGTSISTIIVSISIFYKLHNIISFRELAFFKSEASKIFFSSTFMLLILVVTERIFRDFNEVSNVIICTIISVLSYLVVLYYLESKMLIIIYSQNIRKAIKYFFSMFQLNKK